ncbi:BCCT family transporter [Paracoccus sp. 1_MG-2023]|uniref:BCCT family transporter n=1 Tax=unclassified Paracoccus (in: a-proteobacteria) TaxID=2688777 RepID=UPI001C098E1E|nr:MULTISPECIES: BCCT family transporter [unclassified Paracoccus (in: a-proteobacteria)]MBU2956541.1 BCCT family transporter [Paracoccus sp. C2R09]MDO6668647.1 BCCT family transporter [Paracoccus sp. 1_MG-2023]
MTSIITVAYLSVLACALFVLIRWPRLPMRGESPVGLFTLIALLFTAGLDMGLVMLPLSEFPVYEEDAAFGFTNALAVEFGMWGPLVWLMYFVATFYFVAIEPKLKLFEIPLIKWVYNLTVIATCSFTCYLFMTSLPSYAPAMSPVAVWVLVVTVIAAAVLSSGNMAVMKWLAIISSYGFGTLAFTALAMIAFFYSRVGMSDFLGNIGLLMDYFAHLPRFATPISDYHEFYLFWWFAWSIMIGQFVSRFVGGLVTWQLALAMVFLPAIPLGLWFSVLFVYHQGAITIPGWLNWFMIGVGVVFVINSLDSLIRLYSANLGWSREKLGDRRYYPLHFGVQLGLVAAYMFTPFEIHWVGLIVAGLYGVIYLLLIARMGRLKGMGKAPAPQA